MATLLVRLDQDAAGRFAAEGLRWPGLWIISGHRTRARQLSINPSAPNSLHTRCPSLAADLRVGDQPASITTAEIWTFVGRIWESFGGRWGGRFTPPDLNHFDLASLNVV